MQHLISVDLEEWYHFGGADKETFAQRRLLSEPRLVRNTLRLLAILRQYRIKATFFVLGCIAEEFPDLIKEIAQQGHEIASHGYSHQSLYAVGQEEFSRELSRSLAVLRKLTSQRILGFRAPYFSLNEKDWIWEIFWAHGIMYDSSRCGNNHHRAGSGEWYYKISLGEKESLWEFPVSCLRLGKSSFPVLGGTYLRIMPASFLNAAIRVIQCQKGIAHLYLHPRDIDTTLPRIPMPWMDKIRFSGHIGDTFEKIGYLFRHNTFISIRDFIDACVEPNRDLPCRLQ
ncbi:MAG: polysaccharide deacetylase family protein [Candidatus Omnitrophica bacterium]|nr:polysaccharide deacetylase family protein [Candidatus Omnitrophota bacterium]